jgi:hypothetical protein
MKLRFVCSIALLAGLAVACYAEVSVPKLGLARYADRTVHPVYGLEANLLVDAELLSSADAISFSDKGGLVSIAGRIQLLTVDGAPVGQYDSREQSPVLNIDNDFTTAIAWLPSQGLIVHWNGQAFVATEIAPADLPGKVTSIQVTGTTSAKLLASDGGGNVFAVSVSLATGNIVSVDFLPGVKGPAFQQYSFVVSHDANGLHIQGPDGAVWTVPLAASDLTFERMCSDWLHLSSRSTGEDWALHLSPTLLHLSQLPPPRFEKRLVARPVRPQEVEK